jgi:branched-chain amino acid transport system substrate-binding protein
MDVSRRRNPPRFLRWVAVVALAAAFAAVISACGGTSATGTSGSSGSSGGSGSSGSSSGPIHIGTLLTTSGPAAPYGLPEQNAIQLAIAQANASGGINGRKLTWTHYDTAADTATGISEVHRLISQDNVNLIVGGGTLSGVAVGINPIVTGAHLLFVSTEADPSLTNPVSAHPNTFAMAISTQLVIDRMLQYLQEKHITKVAVLADSTAFSQDGLQIAKSDASKYGIKVDPISYNATATDLTAQLTQAEQQSPGAYLNVTETPSGAVFMKDARSLGLNNKALVMETYTYSNPAEMQLAGSAGDGVIVSASQLSVMDQLPNSDPQKALLAKFSKAYEAMFHSPISIYGAQAYDAATAAIDALRRANGSTDATKLTAALQSSPVPGVQGSYDFTSTDHQGLNVSDVVMTKWNGSSFVLIH